MRRTRLALPAAVLAATLLAACANPDDTASLNQAVATAPVVALAKEKPVMAACAALKLIAKDPAQFGLESLRTNSRVIALGKRGADRWAALTVQVQQAAGSNWMKGSRAATMLYGNWVLFSQPITAALDTSTGVSSPDVPKVKTALTRLQDACATIYQKNWYQVIR
ncbi:MAG: hypothetical protein KGP01_00015 [Actinomycetales bacterium]|nr:hypothetical protein [Actinomycetales bacterium]